MGRWMILTMAMIIAIVVPFLLFGTEIDRRIAAWLARDHAPVLLFLVIFALLAGDILLPIPSSVVATASGALLGPVIGTLAAAAGLTAGSVGAFLLLSRAGAAARDGAGAAVLKRRLRRIGPGALIVLRPVPVLAEASVFLAAAGGAPRWPSVLALTGANIAIAAAYAAMGAWAGREASLGIALLAVCLPALLGWLALSLFARVRRA